MPLVAAWKEPPHGCSVALAYSLGAIQKVFCPALVVRVLACAEAFTPAAGPKVIEGSPEWEVQEVWECRMESRGFSGLLVSHSSQLPTLRKVSPLACICRCIYCDSCVADAGGVSSGPSVGGVRVWAVLSFGSGC